MPSRIISQSICSSDSMANLTWFEQMLFIRLIVSADDYGRCDARPKIIKGQLFPLDDVTDKAIENGLRKLSTNGMISLYESAGRPYLVLCAWFKFNNPRAKSSKFPPPPESCLQMQTDENICKQTDADSPDIRIRNSIFDIRNSDSDICGEPASATAPPVITLPLNDKTEYPVFAEQCQEWAGLYPAVDVIQQLRNMRGWLESNPRKRKTKAGIKRFINAWLAREQDRGKAAGPQYDPAKKDIPKGSGNLGDAELEAIQRVLREDGYGQG